PLCCGRPLYDWGMLDHAKTGWRAIMDSLARDIDEGTLIVGLEPACVSAFRDELIGLHPNDERAKRLAQQTLFFTEFLARLRTRCTAATYRSSGGSPDALPSPCGDQARRGAASTRSPPR